MRPFRVPPELLRPGGQHASGRPPALLLSPLETPESAAELPVALPCEHEQVLVRVLRRTPGRAPVGARREVQEVAVERCRAVGIVGEAGVGRDDRPERLLEELTVIARALGPLDILAAGHLQRAEPVAEQLPHMFLAAPQRRRLRSRWRWGHVGRERAEEVGDQALGGEVEHPNRAPGPAHAQHLVGDRLMVRGEDRPERRRDNVELAGAKGESLGVGFDPLQLDPLRLRLAAAGLEVLGREVGSHNFGPGQGGPDSRVPCAGGDIEHALTRRDSARLDQHRPDLPDRRLGEPVVVPERPGGPRRGLDPRVRVPSCLCHPIAGHAHPPVLRHLLDPGERRRLCHQSSR